MLTAPSVAADEAVDDLARTQPRLASMLRHLLSPTIIRGGYRVNVIPSEAKATIDVRLLPSEDEAALLAEVRRVVNDPAVTVAWAARDVPPTEPDPSILPLLQGPVSRATHPNILFLGVDGPDADIRRPTATPVRRHRSSRATVRTRCCSSTPIPTWRARTGRRSGGWWAIRCSTSTSLQAR